MGAALRQIQRLFVEGILSGLPDGELLERFISGGDEAAFTALVERHGPMVLGTCRAVLRDANAAEDAFQATFLVLVCKARSIRGRGALASWLYQVAQRVATQAGAEAARRRKRERLVGQFRATDAYRAEPDDEWREILHEEVARLSDRYRLPLLLCDLEGKTHAQAATELNCGEATIRRRLTGARELLRSRLIRRGVTLTAGTLATALGRSALAKVPPGWAEAAVKAAARMNSTAAQLAVGEIVSTTAAALARQSLHAMLVSQLRAAAASVVFLIALVGMAWGVGTYGQEKAGVPQTPRMQNPRSTPEALPAPEETEKPAGPSSPKAAAPSERFEYAGRVLDPEGKPVTRAKVHLAYNFYRGRTPPAVRAVTDAGGRFRFSVTKADFTDTFRAGAWVAPQIVATAEGSGLGWTWTRPSADEEIDPGDLTIRMTRDDAPIAGRLIDLEGLPISGATVFPNEILATENGDLSTWLEACRRTNGGSQAIERFHLKRGLWPGASGLPITTTDKDGRFEIHGAGRERLVRLKIEGPTIQTEVINVLTRRGAPIRMNRGPGNDDLSWKLYHGARFEYAAGPTRPVLGVVKDRDSGAPLSGVRIVCAHTGEFSFYNNNALETISDAAGRYRLIGLPKQPDSPLLAIPARDQLYLPALVEIPKAAGLGPLTLDIGLKHGIVIEGRVTDRTTGAPINALVDYKAARDNPSLLEAPGFGKARVEGRHETSPDGTFRVVGLPGRGIVAAIAIDRGPNYLRGIGLPKGVKAETLPVVPFHLLPSYNTFAEIDIPRTATSIRCDLTLVRGLVARGKVVGPDGQPLAGSRIFRELPWPGSGPQPQSEFTIEDLGPGEQRTLFLFHDPKKLAATIAVRGGEPGVSVVQLQPWAAVTGRIVDEDGTPRPKMLLRVSLSNLTPREAGPDGRFRIEPIIPGQATEITVSRNLTARSVSIARQLVLEPGEIKDLGDVRVTEP